MNTPNPQGTPPRVAQVERTLRLAATFLDETRGEVERGAPAGETLMPRLRMAHERRGQATPEIRTFGIPPLGTDLPFPVALSRVIAGFAAKRMPDRILLALEVAREDGTSALVIEAADRGGSRLFWMQAFAVRDGAVQWHEPESGGWTEPGTPEDLILNGAFRPQRGA